MVINTFLSIETMFGLIKQFGGLRQYMQLASSVPSWK
jgi:hypothetical protein